MGQARDRRAVVSISKQTYIGLDGIVLNEKRVTVNLGHDFFL